MKTKKEIEKYLAECIKENENNEMKDNGWDKSLAIELQARISTLEWALGDTIKK
jgi:hypothetical protein